jgi:hypothetical protein
MEERRTWRGPAAKKLFCGFALCSSPSSIMKQQWAVEGEREEKKLKSFRNFALSLSLRLRLSLPTHAMNLLIGLDRQPLLTEKDLIKLLNY